MAGGPYGCAEGQANSFLPSIAKNLSQAFEDCLNGSGIPDATALVAVIKDRIEKARLAAQARRPVGVNGWMLSVILGCLGAEWLLRKRWDLI